MEIRGHVMRWGYHDTDNVPWQAVQTLRGLELARNKLWFLKPLRCGEYFINAAFTSLELLQEIEGKALQNRLGEVKVGAPTQANDFGSAVLLVHVAFPLPLERGTAPSLEIRKCISSFPFCCSAEPSGTDISHF